MFRSTARGRSSRRRQSGYMLLMLMLAVAMLAITLLGVATNYKQSIRREREVEMIHRGVQYRRAVRLYYRKNNSYPPSIDRLLETNRVRYLRKPYKDPMTRDGSWKIATPTDVLSIAGTGLGTSAASGASGAGGTATGTSSQQSGAAFVGGSTAGRDSTQATGSATTSATSGEQTATASPDPASTIGGAGAVLGGGPMIGVVSKSTQEGVHTFYEKSRYNEWLFIYLPAQDTNQLGSIPNGPYNPKANQATGFAGQSGLTTPGQGQGTTMGTTVGTPK